ncbi:uncharacterized protein LACBIDRAFT_299518 [Laccaria bicolor S238N-H82]|uniref:Predicted protein n=1 Tax=Laccaria bicolor (strain S238N-H82 / ATCC MYA-4686) TaxID=486041 RepID=B0E3Q3_LACBS|nr:uncharacterized protein LACBIDRAFT_299518 [Laccaria bicolor S238N-H82]EDQ98528.1 predicted protein [Laccaria bicolor S238N-H82]|eukprot:XP_001890822.1 predicted protein [Laccaria bicolor S238N-H82]
MNQSVKLCVSPTSIREGSRLSLPISRGCNLLRVRRCQPGAHTNRCLHSVHTAYMKGMVFHFNSHRLPDSPSRQILTADGLYNSTPMIGSDCGLVIYPTFTSRTSTFQVETEDYDDGPDAQWFGQFNVLRPHRRELLISDLLIRLPEKHYSLTDQFSPRVSHRKLQIQCPGLCRRAVLLSAEPKKLVCAISMSVLPVLPATEAHGSSRKGLGEPLLLI